MFKEKQTKENNDDCIKKGVTVHGTARNLLRMYKLEWYYKLGHTLYLYLSFSPPQILLHLHITPFTNTHIFICTPPFKHKQTQGCILIFSHSLQQYVHLFSLQVLLSFSFLCVYTIVVTTSRGRNLGWSPG